MMKQSFLLLLLTLVMLPAAVYGSTLYAVCSDQDVLLSINPDTGTGTEIGSLGVNIGNQGINFHPDGTLFGLFWNSSYHDYRLYTMDLETGSATEVGPLNLSITETGTDMAIDDQGRIYGMLGNDVVEIDRETGEGVIVYTLPSGFWLNGLDFSPDGTLYGAGEIDAVYSLVTIDVKQMSYELIGELDTATPGLCFSASGLLYASTGLNLKLIDPDTAAETIIGSIGFSAVNGIDFDPTAILISPASSTYLSTQTMDIALVILTDEQSPQWNIYVDEIDMTGRAQRIARTGSIPNGVSVRFPSIGFGALLGEGFHKIRAEYIKDQKTLYSDEVTYWVLPTME